MVSSKVIHDSYYQQVAIRHPNHCFQGTAAHGGIARAVTQGRAVLWQMMVIDLGVSSQLFGRW
jgi:hypothetical protein